MEGLIDIDYTAPGARVLHTEMDTHKMSRMHNEC